MLHSVLVPALILVSLTTYSSSQISAILREDIQLYYSKDLSLRPTFFVDTLRIRIDML